MSSENPKQSPPKKFVQAVSNQTGISREAISNSDFIENNVFKHAMAINPASKEIISNFPIDGHAHFMADEMGFLVVAYKKLYGLKKHEEIAYAYNKHYPDIDAHVVYWNTNLYPQHEKKLGHYGIFYAVRLKAEVLLNNNIFANEKIETSKSHGFDEEKLREKSKLEENSETFPLYRSLPDNDEIYDPQRKHEKRASNAETISKQGFIASDKTSLLNKNNPEDDHCCVPIKTCTLL